MNKQLYKLSLYFIIVVFICLTTSSCGSHKSVSAPTTISLSDLVARIEKVAGELPDMSTYCSTDKDAGDWFNYLCDFNYDKVDDFYISYATEGTSEELFVVKLKDSKDLNDAVSSLENRIQSRTKTFDMYMPSEVAKLNSAVVVSEGNYIILISCPNISDAKTVFETVLSTKTN